MVAALVAGGAYFIRKMNYANKVTELRDKAKAAEATGDLAGAAKHYRKYVLLRPEDQDALSEAAQVAMRLAESDETKVEDLQIANQLMDLAIRKTPATSRSVVS